LGAVCKELTLSLEANAKRVQQVVRTPSLMTTRLEDSKVVVLAYIAWVLSGWVSVPMRTRLGNWRRTSACQMSRTIAMQLETGKLQLMPALRQLRLLRTSNRANSIIFKKPAVCSAGSRTCCSVRRLTFRHGSKSFRQPSCFWPSCTDFAKDQMYNRMVDHQVLRPQECHPALPNRRANSRHTSTPRCPCLCPSRMPQAYRILVISRLA
jgi:hypothetical protein